MPFIPTPRKDKAKDIPWFEDARRSEGYAGYSTQKKYSTLKSEVIDALNRLGVTELTSFTQGIFLDDERGNVKRPAVSIRYTYRENGMDLPGRLDLAGLPCRTPSNMDQSERMMLWQTARALESMFQFQQMAPGYSFLIPLTEGKNGQTLLQSWIGNMLALPAPDGEIVEEG